MAGLTPRPAKKFPAHDASGVFPVPPTDRFPTDTTGRGSVTRRRPPERYTDERMAATAPTPSAAGDRARRARRAERPSVSHNQRARRDIPPSPSPGLALPGAAG